ncbi:MAG: AI-2E family transporter [Anaerolineales bacterium]|jgi:predicted PurR-regulated permease PerM
MNLSWSLPVRFYVLTVVLILLGILIWVTREMIAPLVVAGMIAYILNALVNQLVDRTRLGHRWAVNLVYFISLGLLIAVPAVLVPVLSSEVDTLSQDLLAIVYRFQSFSAEPILVGGFRINLDTLLPNPGESLAGIINTLPEYTLQIIESTSRNTAWFLVVLVTIYYLLMDWDRVREWSIHLAPQPYQPEIRQVYDEVKKVWTAYVRGQLALMFIVGVIFSIVWLAIGLPGAVVLGILTGLFSLVPEIGPLVAGAMAVAVAFLAGSLYLPLSNGWFALLAAGLYLVLINFKNIWLRPRIMGRSVNLNEGLVFVAIIAAVIFGGVLGALVIVPVLASTIVIGRYLRARILGLDPFPPEQVSLVSETEIPPTRATQVLLRRRSTEADADQD